MASSGAPQTTAISSRCAALAHQRFHMHAQTDAVHQRRCDRRNRNMQNVGHGIRSTCSSGVVEEVACVNSIDPTWHGYAARFSPIAITYKACTCRMATATSSLTSQMRISQTPTVRSLIIFFFCTEMTCCHVGLWGLPSVCSQSSPVPSMRRRHQQRTVYTCLCLFQEDTPSRSYTPPKLQVLHCS